MNQDDVARVLAEPSSQQLLNSHIPARLAYTGLDGYPRAVPVAFLWDGARLLLHALPAAAKVAALRVSPRVAVTIDTERFPAHTLMLRGRAELEDVIGFPDTYVEACRKIVAADQFEFWMTTLRSLYERMVRISIEPDWARLLDFETRFPKAVADLMSRRQEQAAAPNPG